MMLTPKEKQRSPSQAAQVVSQVVHNCKRKLRKWQRQSFLKRNKVSKVVVHEEHTVHYYCPQFPVTHRYEGGASQLVRGNCGGEKTRSQEKPGREAQACSSDEFKLVHEGKHLTQHVHTTSSEPQWGSGHVKFCALDHMWHVSGKRASWNNGCVVGQEGMGLAGVQDCWIPAIRLDGVHTLRCLVPRVTGGGRGRTRQSVAHRPQ